MYNELNASNEMENRNYLTALMCFQDANPVNGPFCSLVRPWIVSKLAPAFSSIQAYCTVRLISENTRNLQVTGMHNPFFNVDTTYIRDLLYYIIVSESEIYLSV